MKVGFVYLIVYLWLGVFVFVLKWGCFMVMVFFGRSLVGVVIVNIIVFFLIWVIVINVDLVVVDGEI